MFFSSSLATKAMKFHPSPQVPALQYVGSVEEAGAADLAGLRTGEFIIEVYNHHKLALLHVVLCNKWCVKNYSLHFLLNSLHFLLTLGVICRRMIMSYIYEVCISPAFHRVQ